AGGQLVGNAVDERGLSVLMGFPGQGGLDAARGAFEAIGLMTAEPLFVGSHAAPFVPSAQPDQRKTPNA
ncbi:MAG: hypothetical protein ACK5JM_01690, partial [Rhodoblastus sp.]